MDSDLDIEDICCFELDGLNFKEMLKRKKNPLVTVNFEISHEHLFLKPVN